MTDDVTVRPADADDAPAIQRVTRASWHAAYDDLIGAEQVDEYVDAWFAPETLVADDVAPDDRPLFVAEDDGVVGFVEAVIDDADPEAASLYRIYVDPAHWGDGVGSALLDRVESVLVARGVQRLDLTVLGPNEGAIAFYEAAGFDRTEDLYDDEFDAPRYRYERSL